MDFPDFQDYMFDYFSFLRKHHSLTLIEVVLLGIMFLSTTHHSCLTGTIPPNPGSETYVEIISRKQRNGLPVVYFSS